LPDRSGLSLRVRATDPLPGLGQTFSSRCQKSRNRPEPMRIALCLRTLRSAGCRHKRIAIKGLGRANRSKFGGASPPARDERVVEPARSPAGPRRPEDGQSK